MKLGKEEIFFIEEETGCHKNREHAAWRNGTCWRLQNTASKTSLAPGHSSALWTERHALLSHGTSNKGAQLGSGCCVCVLHGLFVNARAHTYNDPKASETSSSVWWSGASQTFARREIKNPQTSRHVSLPLRCKARPSLDRQRAGCHPLLLRCYEHSELPDKRHGALFALYRIVPARPYFATRGKPLHVETRPTTFPVAAAV